MLYCYICNAIHKFLVEEQDFLFYKIIRLFYTFFSYFRFLGLEEIICFHRIGPLGRFGLVVAMAMDIYICIYIYVPLSEFFLAWGPMYRKSLIKSQHEFFSLQIGRVTTPPQKKKK